MTVTTTFTSRHFHRWTNTDSALWFISRPLTSEINRSFKGNDCLTWARFENWNGTRNCIWISHRHHPQLRDLTGTAGKEIANSKRRLRKGWVARSTRSLTVTRFLRQHGFQKDAARLASQGGLPKWRVHHRGESESKSEPLFLERLPVNYCAHDALFPAKLTGDTTGLGPPSTFPKRVKVRLRGSTGA